MSAKIKRTTAARILFVWTQWEVTNALVTLASLDSALIVKVKWFPIIQKLQTQLVNSILTVPTIIHHIS